MTVIGSNGAGKSTLVIDALTWCIYGRTSLTDLKGYKIEDLVRVGARECYAEIEFELVGDIYTVRRTYNLARKNSTLDVFFNKKHMNYKIKDAEDFLSEHIGLDYEGFVNSTIIRQEEMKRLISEDPSKRKDIFISLFRLGIYEDALDTTKTERMEEEKKLSEIKASQSTMETLLSQETDWENKEKSIGPKVKEIEQSIIQCEHELQTAESAVSKLEESNKSLVVKETKLDGTKARITSLRTRLKDYEIETSKLKEEIKEYTMKAKETEALRDSYDQMMISKEEYSKASNEREMIEQLIRVRLEQDSGEINELEKELVSLQQEMNSVSNQTTQKGAELKASDLVRDHRASIDQLEKSARSVGKAESDLATAESLGYSKEKVIGLRNALREDKLKLSSTKEAVEKTLSNIVTELPKLSATQTRLGKIKEEIDQLQNKITDRQNAIKEESILIAQGAGKKPITLREARKLANYYDLKVKQLVDSGYSEASMEALKRKVDESTAAKEMLIKVKETLTASEKSNQSLRSEYDALTEESKSLEEGVRSLAPIREEYRKAKENVTAIQRRHSDLKASLEGLGKQQEEIQSNLRRIQSYRKTIEDLKEKQNEFERSISDYRNLETVFHRDGIPSVILRRIIPRVASEASSILADLTEGRYDAITIEEQEDGKLNIWVKDGDQRYGVHRFSGGEKVRIALAVRLAVSKVLSELPEAGKRLSRMKTLIIDEGDLGSLDGEGLNSTMTIINDLTKLFGLTVLISHLEAVKNWVNGNYVIVHRAEPERGSTIEYA
jgi:exonuclease SbcC